MLTKRIPKINLLLTFFSRDSTFNPQEKLCRHATSLVVLYVGSDRIKIQSCQYVLENCSQTADHLTKNYPK